MRMTMQQKLHDQLLRYGKITKDIEFNISECGSALPTGCHRVRIISYLGFIYYDHMLNGEMLECLLLGKE